MATAHDELFCRLAIRKGLFTREVGIEIIQRFRSERKQKLGIAGFAVEEGYIDGDSAAEIEDAIARRAAGHVSELPRTATPPPHPAGHAHGHPSHHHHAHGHRAPRSGANATQIAVVTMALLIVLGCVLFVVLKMSEPSASRAGKEPISSPIGSKPPDKVREFKTPEMQKQAIQQRQVSDEEMTRLRSQAEDAISVAQYAQLDQGSYKALEILATRKKNMGGEMLPELILQRLGEAQKELESHLEERYKTLLRELQSAQGSNDAKGIETTLAEIELKCGPERLASAKQELKLP